MLDRLLRALALFVVCGFAQAVTVLDDTQNKVEIPRTPQRIVSLLPSLTETVCALGQCPRLVGVDRYSNWPDSIQALPRMGGGIDPNIERIVTQKPDLVLLAGSTRGVERLQSLGITVLRLEPRTHADVIGGRAVVPSFHCSIRSKLMTKSFGSGRLFTWMFDRDTCVS